MNPPSPDALIRIARALQAKDAAALKEFTSGTDPLLSPRADGTYYLSKELFRVAASASREPNTPHGEAAKHLLDQARKRDPGVPGPSRRNEFRAVPGEQSWLRDALAVAFAIRSYGVTAGRTMLDPLVTDLRRRGILQVSETPGGYPRMDFSTDARAQIHEMSGSNPVALLLSGIIRAGDIGANGAARPGHAAPQNVAQKEADVRRVTPSQPGPKELDASSPPPAPSRRPVEADLPANERKILSDLVHVHSLQREADIEGLQAALLALRPEVSITADGKISVSREILALVERQANGNSPSEDIRLLAKAVVARDGVSDTPSSSQSPQPASSDTKSGSPTQETTASPSPTSVPLSEAEILKGMHSLYLSAAVESPEDVSHALQKSNPRLHEALFGVANSHGQPLLTVRPTGLALTAGGTATVKARFISEPRSRIAQELVLGFEIAECLPALRQNNTAKPQVDVRSLPQQSVPMVDEAEGPAIG